MDLCITYLKKIEIYFKIFRLFSLLQTILTFTPLGYIIYESIYVHLPNLLPVLNVKNIQFFRYYDLDLNEIPM